MAKINRRKSRKGNSRSKLIIFATVMVVAFIALVGRLAYISLIRHDYYSELATSQQLRDTGMWDP